MNAPRLEFLMIEDNSVDAHLVQLLLLESGSFKANVTLCDRMDKALKHLETEHADLILMDLGLPDSSHNESLARVAELSRAHPVIILTGTDDPISVDTCLASGAQDYLIKGRYGADILDRSIRHSLDRYQLVAGLRRTNMQLKTLLKKYESAKSRIESLEGLLPICAWCGRIRVEDERGPEDPDWQTVDEFLHTQTQAEVTHCICHDCLSKQINPSKSGNKNG